MWCRQQQSSSSFLGLDGGRARWRGEGGWDAGTLLVALGTMVSAPLRSASLFFVALLSKGGKSDGGWAPCCSDSLFLLLLSSILMSSGPYLSLSLKPWQLLVSIQFENLIFLPANTISLPGTVIRTQKTRTNEDMRQKKNQTKETNPKERKVSAWIRMMWVGSCGIINSVALLQYSALDLF